MLRALLNKSWQQPLTKQQLQIHLPPHPTKHPSKTNKTCGALLEKQEWTHQWRSFMDFCTWTWQCYPTNEDVHQFCADTRCSLEDLPDRDGWWERFREVCANSATWWYTNITRIFCYMNIYFLTLSCINLLPYISIYVIHVCVCVCMYVCMYECKKRERERGEGEGDNVCAYVRVCMYMSKREREREREIVCVRICECVCMCVREREGAEGGRGR